MIRRTMAAGDNDTAQSLIMLAQLQLLQQIAARLDPTEVTNLQLVNS